MQLKLSNLSILPNLVRKIRFLSVYWLTFRPIVSKNFVAAITFFSPVSCAWHVGIHDRGVTRVGITRGGNWGVTPILRKKSGDPFSHYRLSVLQCHPYSPEIRTTFFCSSLSLLLILLGCHPLGGCHPTPFLPVRPRSSTILCKFAFKIFFLRVTPPGGCHPGRSPLFSVATDPRTRFIGIT